MSVKQLKNFWRNEDGQVNSAEYIFLTVMIGIGAIVGLATLRDQVAQELADTATALNSLDQTFIYAVPNADYDGTQTVDVTTLGFPPAAATGFDIMYYQDNAAGDVDFTDAANVGPAGMNFAAATGSESTNVGMSMGDSN